MVKKVSEASLNFFALSLKKIFPSKNIFAIRMNVPLDPINSISKNSDFIVIFDTFAKKRKKTETSLFSF